MNPSLSAVAGAPIPQRIKQAILAVEPRATILLYGSRARGDARPDSDWDVLVLVDGPLDAARLARVWGVGASVGVEAQARINVLARSRDQWESPLSRQSLFRIHVDAEAVALTPYDQRRPPATEDEVAEARRRTVEAWFRLAQVAMSQADVLAGEEQWNRAVRALYDCGLYAATALLARYDLHFSRHEAVQEAFSARYGATGAVPPDLIELYNSLLASRRRMDNDPLCQFTAAEVQPLIDGTRRLLAMAEQLLAGPPAG